MIKDLFAKTFDLFRFNTILIQPILLFILLIWTFISPLSEVSTFSIAILVHFVLLCALTCALVAGWLNMFLVCVKSSDKKYSSEEERTTASLSLLKEFIPGIGMDFVNIFIAFIVYLVLLLGFTTLISAIGNHFIGIPHSYTPENLKLALASESNMMKFVNSISPAERIQVSHWYLLSTLSYGLFAYLLMFWPVAIISTKKNPVIALFSSIKTILKAPFTTFVIYFIGIVVFFALTIFNLAFGNNLILSFLGLILFIYALVYFILMLFLYYEETSENISNSGSDGLRKNESGC